MFLLLEEISKYLMVLQFWSKLKNHCEDSIFGQFQKKEKKNKPGFIQLFSA